MARSADMHPVIKRVGARLRAARMQANLTVREAAERLGEAENHVLIVRYENGSIRPQIDRLAQIAAVYDTSLAALFVERDDVAVLLAALEQLDEQRVQRLIQVVRSL